MILKSPSQKEEFHRATTITDATDFSPTSKRSERSLNSKSNIVEKRRKFEYKLSARHERQFRNFFK